MLNEMRESARTLEKDLGLPEGFLEGLQEEDDWSFIIKIHALMEGAVSYLLVHYFGDTRLSKIFDFLELSDKRKGKVAFVSALELLPVQSRRFLSKLSEIRNSLVHNVINVSFDLAGYVRGLNKEQIEVLISSLESIDLSQIDFGKNNEHRKEWIAINSKHLIYRMALITMGFIYLKRENAELERELNKTARQKLSAIVGLDKKDDPDAAT